MMQCDKGNLSGFNLPTPALKRKMLLQSRERNTVTLLWPQVNRLVDTATCLDRLET
jgi:hypothetical protein